MNLDEVQPCIIFRKVTTKNGSFCINSAKHQYTVVTCGIASQTGTQSGIKFFSITKFILTELCKKKKDSF